MNANETKEFDVNRMFIKEMDPRFRAVCSEISNARHSLSFIYSNLDVNGELGKRLADARDALYDLEYTACSYELKQNVK